MADTPRYSDIENHVVQYVDCHRHKDDPCKGTVMLGKPTVANYRSDKSWGTWFGQWWNVEVDLVSEIDFDGPQSNTRRERVEMTLPGRKWTVGQLADAFPQVRVSVTPTGLIWPTFLYMDRMPVTLLAQGAYWQR